MKKILGVLAVSFFMIGMVACDKIEEPYFKPNNEGTDVVPLPEDDVNHWENKKVVLLEDFTGVKCVNCPKAAVLASELQAQYGHQLVVMGVHAGGYANPIGGFPDFTTVEGEEWNTAFKFNSYPTGTINRQYNGSSYGYNSAAWADAVAEAVNGQPDIRLLSAVKYDDSKRELKVSVYSKFLKEFSDKYNLTVCLMEDNVVGKQLGDGGGDDYVHRHVFRGTLNGTWGTELNEDIIAPDTEIIKNYTIKINDNFNVDNCYVVAYVYLRDTYEILQVNEKKIK